MTETGQPAFSELPLGTVKPTGWLRRQLTMQAAGITGRLDEIWGDVGPDSAWLGGQGEDWERGPYYLDGLLPLAFILHDAALQAKAQKWVEAILASQRPDGQFGPGSNDDWWPRMVAMKVLTQYADATSDERVQPFLARYFAYQAAELPGRPLAAWAHARGADNVLAVMWLHARTPEPWLLDLAQLLLGQTLDWERFLTTELAPGHATTFDHRTHGPNVAMGLKTPAMAYLVDDQGSHRVAAAAMLANLQRLHGLVHGVFSGDEWLAGRSPQQGVETCQVVELMFTLEQLARVFGDGSYGDLLEATAYNLLPASNDARMLAHQYHQQANQISATVARRGWSYSGDDANVFGLEPHFGCCTANLHQGWPKFVRSMWMATPDGGLAALAYGPCNVTAEISGTTVRLDVRTEYPFEDTVRIVIDIDAPRTFPIRLRLPEWTAKASLHVGETGLTDLVPDGMGYITVEREWTAGETLTLTLPMAVRVVPRDGGAVGLRLGPLVLVHSLGENWHPVSGAPGLGEWEITPRHGFNDAIDLTRGVDAWTVDRQPPGDVPFLLEQAPVTVHADGARLTEWTADGASAGTPPSSPVPSRLPVQRLPLVPYGNARLRIAEFPVVLQAADRSSEFTHSRSSTGLA